MVPYWKACYETHWPLKKNPWVHWQYGTVKSCNSSRVDKSSWWYPDRQWVHISRSFKTSFPRKSAEHLPSSVRNLSRLAQHVLKAKQSTAKNLYDAVPSCQENREMKAWKLTEQTGLSENTKLSTEWWSRYANTDQKRKNSTKQIETI